ncbi:translocation/assembly module TamB domain-containing protein [Desulfovibrio desulfuricans]|uniref:translocation/assembly module TamB domain-containing protein n=1 Tax=Desulfovibrio desulfuricans TaxID=876 RepID=UPI001AE92880|nr:translocation/assembly module TamB domain-containing protein [Desulfovibrio desulfuricans]QTO40030.1 translocation/assembly module TamB domain-containing protein [Desulfovibrio desulfuricans]
MDQEHSAAPPSSSSSASAALGGKASPSAGQPGHRKPSGGGSGPFRKWLRRAGWALGLCVLLCVIALAAILVPLRSDSVQGWLTEKINTAMEAAPDSGATPAGVRARITHLSGSLPFEFSLGVELFDNDGLWMRLPDCRAQWDWRALPLVVRIASVDVNDAQLLRLPILLDAPEPASAPPLTEAALRTMLGDALRSLGGLPGWLPQVRLEGLNIFNARLPQALLGGAPPAAARNETPPVATGAAPAAEKSAPSAAEAQPAAPGAALPERHPDTQGRGQNNTAADASLEANLSLVAGTQGAQASLLVRIACAEDTPLHVAGAAIYGVESTALLTLAPSRVGEILAFDATAELAAILRRYPDPVAEDSPASLPASSPVKISSATDQATESGALAALLREGANARLRLAARVTAPTVGGEAAGASAVLENISVEAGPLHLVGHAKWDAGGAASWLDGPLDVDIQASLGEKTDSEKEAAEKSAPASAAAPSTKSGGLLPERAQLRITAKGPLQTPDTQIALDCPAWNVGGHALADISLKLQSTPLNWGRVLLGALKQTSAAPAQVGLSDPGQKDAEQAAELTVKMQASAVVDSHPQRFGATLFALNDREDGPGLLRAGVRDLQCQLLGVAGSGQLAAALPLPPLAGGMPRVDGKVDVRVADWQALSAMLPGARLDGDAALSLELVSQRAEPVVPTTTQNSSGQDSSVQNPPAQSPPDQNPQAQTKQTPAPQAAYTQQATLRWRVPRLAYRAGNGQPVEAHGLEGEAVLTDALGKGLLAARLDLAGVRSGAIRLGAKLRAQGSIFGPLEASLETGGFAATRCAVRWQPGLLELRRLDLDLPAQKLGLHAAAGATVRYGAGDLAVSGLDVAMKPSGRLRAQAALGPEKLDLRLTLEHLSLAPWHVLIPALPKGELEASARLTGTPAQPGGDIRVDARGLVVPGAALKPMNLALTGKLERDNAGGGAMALRLVPDQATVAALGGTECRVEARLPLLFGPDGLPSLNMQGPLRASLRWNGAVAPLWSLMPVADQRLAGRLALSLDVGGSLEAPAPMGFVRMDDTRYENLQYGVLLTGINLRLDLEEGRGGALGLARLNLGAADGQGGTARITGQGRLDGSMLDFNAVVDHLRPLRRRDIRVELSAQASVAGSAAAPQVRGTVTVNQGLVLLNNLDVGTSITTLPISEVSPAWARAGHEPPTPAVPQGKKTASPAAVGPAPTAPASGGSAGLLDLRIVIPGSFVVEGFGLKSEWKADMHVGGTPAEPLISGQLNAVKGSLDILGKNFKLARGAVTFGGGAVSNPLLDIMLTTQTPALMANISIVGTVHKMQLILSSAPEMPRDEILAQILFGKSASELGRFENLRLAAAVAQLAGFGSGSGGGGVLDSARQALGVDVLRFNSGASGTNGTGQSGQGGEGMAAGSSVEMGKYLTEDIYVGVQQGAKQGTTAFVIQLELTPRANLELRTEQQSTKGGLTWKYNY